MARWDWGCFRHVVAAALSAGVLLWGAGCASLNDRLTEIDQMSMAGRHDEALAALEPLIAAHPETQRPRGLKTDILLRKGDVQQALQLQKQVVADIPDKWYAHYHLGLIYLEYLRRPAEAIEPLEQAQRLLLAGGAEIPPENRYNLLVSLAKAYDGAKRYDDALDACRQILATTPGDPWALAFQQLIEKKKAALPAGRSSPATSESPSALTTGQ
ncbi:MAG: hypothetical protein Kow0059_08990 [Candidatus Sumerlaeia bacterium]